MRTLTSRILVGIVLALVALVSLANWARAGSGCCAHCGCAAGCQRVCRLVCENKKVTTTCWGVQNEEFCIPGPSTPNCEHCETVCEENDPKAPCTQPKKFVWTEWISSGHAKVHTKKKLMKKTVTKTVPSFKWVVEDLCPQCQTNGIGSDDRAPAGK